MPFHSDSIVFTGADTNPIKSTKWQSFVHVDTNGLPHRPSSLQLGDERRHRG